MGNGTIVRNADLSADDVIISAAPQIHSRLGGRNLYLIPHFPSRHHGFRTPGEEIQRQAFSGKSK